MTTKKQPAMPPRIPDNGSANLAAPPSWQKDGVCSTVDPDLHHPDGWGRQDRDQIAAAKLVCSDCPVAAVCLDWAIATDEPWGVWGGATRPERQAIAQERTRKAQQAARDAELREQYGQAFIDARDALRAIQPDPEPITAARRLALEVSVDTTRRRRAA